MERTALVVQVQNAVFYIKKIHIRPQNISNEQMRSSIHEQYAKQDNFQDIRNFPLDHEHHTQHNLACGPKGSRFNTSVESIIFYNLLPSHQQQ